MEGGSRKLFSSTQLNFPNTCVCIHSFCMPAHLPTLCLCMNHQIFQVFSGHYDRFSGEALVWKPNYPYLSNLSHLLIQNRCLALCEEVEVGPSATANTASTLRHWAGLLPHSCQPGCAAMSRTQTWILSGWIQSTRLQTRSPGSNHSSPAGWSLAAEKSFHICSPFHPFWVV